MDFDESPEDVEFRAEVSGWLSAHALLRDAARPQPTIITFENAEAELTQVKRSRAWQRTLFEHGWAGITWPREYGGRGGMVIQQIIFNQEEARFDLPGSVFVQGIGLVGPTIMAHGTEEQKERFLTPILRGDHVWCQLFSEPGAGSDLAALSTRAIRDGGGFVVNGQKVWTSSAHFSDWGILLARTDLDAPKHRGITCFLVDMKSPGIDVRPLRQATGSSRFNEVFLTDVQIPESNVVGPVNRGWGVAMTTLTNERAVIGSTGGIGDAFGELFGLAREFGRTDEPLIRQRLIDAYIRIRLLKYLGLRTLTAISQNKQPGPEGSVLKLALSRHLSTTADLVMSLMGPEGMLLDYANPDASDWQLQFVGQWSVKLGGGTEQIQCNIVGERVLGLPSEPRVDKDVPFRQALSGTFPS